jgi:hypothetical protein
MLISESKMNCLIIKPEHMGGRICEIDMSEDQHNLALFSIVEPPELELMLSDPTVQQVQACQNFSRVRVCYDNDIKEVILFANGQRLALCDGRTFVIVRNRQPATFLVIAQDQKRALAIMFMDHDDALAALSKIEFIGHIQ